MGFTHCGSQSDPLFGRHAGSKGRHLPLCFVDLSVTGIEVNQFALSAEKKFSGFVDVCDRTFKVKITAPGYAEHTELRRIRILPKPLSLDMVENASFSEYEDGDGGLITSRLKMKDVEPCVIQDKDWAIVEIGMQTDSIVVRGLGNYCGTIRVQIGGTPITHQGKPVAPKGKDTETPSDEPLKIFPAPQFRDYAGVYDGKPHGLELSDCACVDAPGFRCTWFNNSSRSWESELPQFVDVCDKNINIRIEAAGYRARNEVRRIKIIRKDLNVSMVKEAVVERSETGELVPKIVLEDNEPCVVRDVDREIFDYGEGYVDIDGKGNYCGTIRVQIGGTPIAHQGKPVAPMRPNQNKWLKWLGLSGVILFLIGVGLVADRQYDEEQMRFASEERRKAEVKHVRTAEAVHKDAAQKGNESTNAAQSGTGGKARMPMQKRKTTDEFVRAARNAFVAKDWKTGFDIATNISMNAMSDSYVTYYVGYCYSPTYGTDYPKKKDYEKAYEWFKHTAELEQKSGGGIVQCILGDMEMNGQGCAANIDNAVAWYRISAERKYGRGCYELGKCYEDNIVADTNDNLVAATNWYFKAMSLEYESAKEAHERVLKKKSRIEKLCSRQR